MPSYTAICLGRKWELRANDPIDARHKAAEHFGVNPNRINVYLAKTEAAKHVKAEVDWADDIEKAYKLAHKHGIAITNIQKNGPGGNWPLVSLKGHREGVQGFLRGYYHGQGVNREDKASMHPGVYEGHVGSLGAAPSPAERQRIRSQQPGNADRRLDPRLHAAHPAKQGGWKYQDDATEEEAAGYNARCDGEPITSNPFGSEKGDAYLSWRAGWLDANDSLAAHGVGESVEDLVTRILEVYDDGSIDAFTYGYLTAALRHSDGPDGLPLSRRFTVGDIAPECIDALEVDCLKFQEENPELKSEAAGYGFWSGHPVPLHVAEDGTVRCDDR